jgi:hypothetical protein
MMKQHGVENALQLPETRRALEQASLARYGTTTPVVSSEVQAKVRETCLQRYGTEHMFQNADVQHRAHEVQGKAYALQSWDARLKVIQANQQLELVSVDKSYQGLDAVYEWRHSCGTIYAASVKNGIVRACPKCKLSFVSNQERELADFVEQLTPIDRNNRSLLGRELDIYIPSMKLAIEYNGLYWHSTAVNSDPARHLAKTLLAEAKGIRLVQVFEDEWLTKRAIVESRLKELLGASSKLYADDCELIDVSASEATLFLEQNHLQGSVKASARLGLMHDDKLVALIVLNKIGGHAWELLRYCSKLDTVVEGGIGLLLKSFSRMVNSYSIVSYVDRRWSTGIPYEQLGFSLIRSTPPEATYVIDGARMSFQAMLDEGFDLKKHNKIYDCGTLVYELRG